MVGDVESNELRNSRIPDKTLAARGGVGHEELTQLSNLDVKVEAERPEQEARWLGQVHRQSQKMGGRSGRAA